MNKSLDEKLARIRAGTATDRDFILADAKDADMAFGVAAPGPKRDGSGWKSLPEYLEQARAIVRQGLVDIMLLSASNLERLTTAEQLFRDSAVTPAARANDSSDIWLVRGGSYATQPSRPFHSASIDQIKYGRANAEPSRPVAGADLGLYSVTFTNNLEADHRTLEAFRAFRDEAESKGFRYFLEVFNPNVATGIESQAIGQFLNDHIARTLAGVTSRARPLFLKIPYHGPSALEELLSYDPSLVVGIMGGAAGTTRDAFELLSESKRHGGRAALFGRKINLSDHPLAFVENLRRIASGEIGPVEGVKAYHDALRQAGVQPARDLESDLLITDPALSR